MGPWANLIMGPSFLSSAKAYTIQNEKNNKPKEQPQKTIPNENGKSIHKKLLLATLVKMSSVWASFLQYYLPFTFFLKLLLVFALH